MVTYRELSSLEQDLGIKAKTLYAVSNHLTKHYRKVSLPKKSGGYRNLSIPDDLLKAIQKRIADVLLIHMPVSEYATAYGFNCSTIRNAKPHVNKPVVLKLDILHFFDSIRYTSVKDLAFPKEIYAEPIRILLSMLCYYKDTLPQGAPSSPVITNIILYEFDEQVGQWCKDRKITYTRYCDDMTFSGNFIPAEVTAYIRKTLNNLNLLLNVQKICIQHIGQQQKVTGIVVNEKLSIPADYRRKLRQDLYYCQKFGIENHLNQIQSSLPEDEYRRQLLGKINYVLQVHPNNSELLQAKKWLMHYTKQKG